MCSSRGYTERVQDGGLQSFLQKEMLICCVLNVQCALLHLCLPLVAS